MSASVMPRTGAVAVAIVPRVPCDPIARRTHPAWRHVNPCATPAPFQGEVLQTVPNVRGKREATARRQARAAENVARRRPGLANCRWRFA